MSSDRGDPVATANLRAREGHRLLQIGVALLLFTSFEGKPVRT